MGLAPLLFRYPLPAHLENHLFFSTLLELEGIPQAGTIADDNFPN
jgi:hypothetical protein